MTVTKRQLIRQVAEKTNIGDQDAAMLVDMTLDVIRETLAAGESVQLRGFGAFSLTRTEARSGRHPRTGARLAIPARERVRFHAGEQFIADGRLPGKPVIDGRLPGRPVIHSPSQLDIEPLSTQAAPPEAPTPQTKHHKKGKSRKASGASPSARTQGR